MEKQNNRIKNWFIKAISQYSSLFAPIMMSFICILVLGLVSIGFSYFRNAKTIRKSMENYNMQITIEIKRTIDNKINMAIQKIYEFCYDKRILGFALKHRFYEPDSIMSALDVINFSSNVSVTHEQIEDVFIYFNNTNVILNRMTYYSPEDFFLNTCVSEFGINLEQWFLLLQSYKNFDFFTAATPDKDVIIFKSAPLTDRNNAMALVGLRLSGAQISNTLNSLSTINDLHAYIVTDSGKIIGRSANAIDEEVTFLPDILGENSGVYYDKVNGIESLVTFTKSSHSDWNYVSVEPVNVVMGELNNFRVMTVGMTIVFMLFSILLIIYVKRKSYNPIKKLIVNIKSNYIYNEGVHINEIQVIEDTLNRLSKQYQDIKNDMKDQYPIIRNNMLISILKEIKPTESIYENMRKVDINFEYEGFIVLSVDIEEISDLKSLEINGDRLLIKTIITNIAQDVFQTVGRIYMVELDWNKFTVIINSNSDLDKLDLMVYECSVKFADLLKSLFSLIITVGISEGKRGINNIPELYEEAEEALTYKFLSGVNTVNRFRSSEFNTNNYFYPIHIEHKLINNVTSGNKKQAIDIIDTILDKNFRNTSYPVKYSKCLFFDIISTVLKIYNELKINFSDIFGCQFDTEKELLECKTIDDMYDIICSIIIRTCDYVNSRTKSKNEKLINHIIDYINNNYCSNDICIMSIAESVGITQYYLSHYFKEKTGNSIMKYIEELRINKIKQLLISTSLTLADIAEKVGFSNSAVLIRAFKKNEGITPGEYREKSRIL